jgi:hypothetical protein
VIRPGAQSCVFFCVFFVLSFLSNSFSSLGYQVGAHIPDDSLGTWSNADETKRGIADGRAESKTNRIRSYFGDSTDAIRAPDFAAPRSDEMRRLLVPFP